jgi:hypothetical protein
MEKRVEAEEKAGYMIYNEKVKNLLIALDKFYQDADEERFSAALLQLETLIPTLDPITLESINTFLNDLGRWKIESVRTLTFN